MDDLELICFKMISNAGAARSHFMESMKYSREFAFDKAQEAIEGGSKCRLEAHDIHFDLLQKDSAKDLNQVSLLLIHAEDQLMVAEVFEVLAQELLALYQKQVDKN